MEQLWEGQQVSIEKNRATAKRLTKWLLWSLVAAFIIWAFHGGMPEHEYKAGDWDVGTLYGIYHKPGSRVVTIVVNVPYHIEGGRAEYTKPNTMQVSGLHFISGNHIDWLNNELKGRQCSFKVLSAEKEYLMKADIFCMGGFGNLSDYVVANGMGY